MSFTVKILGTSSATFSNERNQSSQALKAKNSYYIIDCGEGTQIQLKKNSIKTQKIDAIFISHLHGDHYLGLFGLLSTMSLNKREKPLSLYGPKGLKEIITTQLQFSGSYFYYPVYFKEIKTTTSQVIHKDKNITVSAFPIQHGIECYGFRFDAPQVLRKLIIDKLPKNTPLSFFKPLKEGKDLTLESGEVIKSDDVTHPAPSAVSYAYCSDTSFAPQIVPFIKNVTTLYHEATFTEEFIDRAISTNHSTAKQAAQIAKLANASQLLVAHYSARYKDSQQHFKEASEVFKNVICLNDNDTIEIKNPTLP